MQVQDLMAQVMAAMAMFNELAKSQQKPAAVQQVQQEKPKLEFVEFRRFTGTNLRILEAKNSNVVAIRKGKQFVAFMFTREVAEALSELINKHYPADNSSPRKRGRGA